MFLPRVLSCNILINSCTYFMGYLGFRIHNAIGFKYGKINFVDSKIFYCNEEIYKFELSDKYCSVCGKENLMETEKIRFQMLFPYINNSTSNKMYFLEMPGLPNLSKEEKNLIKFETVTVKPERYEFEIIRDCCKNCADYIEYSMKGKYEIFRERKGKLDETCEICKKDNINFVNFVAILEWYDKRWREKEYIFKNKICKRCSEYIGIKFNKIRFKCY